MIATASPHTAQTLSVDSPDWKRFLRKVIAGDGEWIARAYAPEWTLTFSRSVRGKIGEPDSEIVVQTDCVVRCAPAHRFGEQRSFTDSSPVFIPNASRLCVHRSECETLARLLLDGAAFEIQPSSGSTSSSKHGLAFVSLVARLKGSPYSQVELGCTTYIHGQRIISGPID